MKQQIQHSMKHTLLKQSRMKITRGRCNFLYENHKQYDESIFINFLISKVKIGIVEKRNESDKLKDINHHMKSE